MRLERLEVTGFGRLQQRRFDFGERITVVLGPNESGKSTLHRAIRAALYGLEAGGPGRPRERSDWARWLPWRGERYGVVLTYRLDSGARFRIAQSFDRGKLSAQVQELGGGDVTQLFRSGRSVSPARVHLGIDEAVFCAAGWLGEEGLHPLAPDAPGVQAPRVREALERLVDSGPGGSTAATALERLREGLRRVGSERRSGTPLGVAIAQARRLEAEIDSARRRLAAFAADEERLDQLEGEAAAATESARTAQRAWLLGRIAQIDAEADASLAIAAEISALEAALGAEDPPRGFSVGDEAQVIALGGELHQVERAAAESELRWRSAAEPLAEIRRRRFAIAAGLRVMPSATVSGPTVERADDLRRRLAVSQAAATWGEELSAATARDQALRREIAVTGLGGLASADLEAVAPLVTAAHSQRRRVRALIGAGAGLSSLGVLLATALWIAGHRIPSVALAASVAAILCGLAVAGWLASAAAARAHRELAGRFPAAVPGAAGMAQLASALPAARRLHLERERQAAVADAGRAELARVTADLEEVAEECAELAREAGVATPARPPRGSPSGILLNWTGAALTAVEEAARQAARRQELISEEGGLAAQEVQLAELGTEAERRRQAALAIEAAIRRIVGPAGIDPSLPPLAAVATFRKACEQRRHHDALATRLVEGRRRQAMSSMDPGQSALRRSELAAELRQLNGDPADAARTAPPGAAQLAALERGAAAAQQRASVAGIGLETLRARLEGMMGSLPSLADLEDDRLAVTAARDRALHQQAALQRAAELIEAAGREVHSQVAPRLASAVSQRLALLTDDRYREVNVDVEHFAVSLASVERDQLVPLELVSHGTRDQVSLLLRLSLCELLGEGGEAMPLLLDEPMASADPWRRSGLSDFLAQLSVTNQLVVTSSDPGLAVSVTAQMGSEQVRIIDLETEIAAAPAETPAPITASGPSGPVLRGR